MLYRKVLKFSSSGETDIIDITSQVEQAVKESKIKNGFCLVFNKGSTGAIIINENERMLKEDIKQKLNEIIPKEAIYHHPNNAHSHMRALFLGSGKTIPVKDGLLDLGTWQSIMFAEMDVGPRSREVVVSVLGE